MFVLLMASFLAAQKPPISLEHFNDLFNLFSHGFSWSRSTKIVNMRTTWKQIIKKYFEYLEYFKYLKLRADPMLHVLDVGSFFGNDNHSWSANVAGPDTGYFHLKNELHELIKCELHELHKCFAAIGLLFAAVYKWLATKPK
jgi:hypothetical protein